MRATVELLQPDASRRGSRIVVNAAPDLPPALGDQGELGQVFSNLLANALKYGRDDGRVDVTIALAAERPAAHAGQQARA